MRTKMNERIRELAMNAWEYVLNNDAPDGVHFKRDWYDEKFAELIVKDCTRIVTNNGIATAEHDQMVRQDCVNEINEHFGVK